MSRNTQQTALLKELKGLPPGPLCKRQTSTRCCFAVVPAPHMFSVCSALSEKNPVMDKRNVQRWLEVIHMRLYDIDPDSTMGTAVDPEGGGAACVCAPLRVSKTKKTTITVLKDVSVRLYSTKKNTSKRSKTHLSVCAWMRI